MGRLDGRVALITGSGRNIGRAMALRFAEEGADVVVNDLDRPAADSVVDEVRAIGGRALAAVADVASRAEVDRMVAAAFDAFGRVDILVNMAAIRPKKPFVELTVEDWELVRSIVLDGAFHCTHAVVPSMMERRFGRIVFFGGDGAWRGSALRAHVSAAKMGLVGLCRGLASELGTFNIRLNVISPGRIDTARAPGWTPSRSPNADIPLGRPGAVGDIVSAGLFLVSDESDWITGQTLHVNGGDLYF